MTRRIGLIVEYDGSPFAGFQRQANAPSVQGALEGAIASLTGQSTVLKGAGRTDAGVHAKGQVAAFDTESVLDTEHIRQGLNYYLPGEVSVVAAYDVAASFDPRRDALSRVYRYTFVAGRSRSPLRQRYAMHLERDVDVAGMTEALAYLEGERGFAPFCGRFDRNNTVRRIHQALAWRQGDSVHIEVEGTAFLPQQVRRIAGAALEVGLGERTIEGFRELADSSVRGAANRVLPPHGLCLIAVKYPGFPPGKEHAVTANDKAHTRQATLA